MRIYVDITRLIHPKGNMWLWLVFIGVCLAGLVAALLRRHDSNEAKKIVWEEAPPKAPFPFIKRPSLLWPTEFAFYQELKRQIPNRLHVTIKPRLADIVDSKTSDYDSMRQIWARHVDFLICDGNLKPVFVIELNGQSHSEPKQMARDKEVKDILEGVGIPLEVVVVGELFPQSVADILNKYS